MNRVLFLILLALIGATACDASKESAQNEADDAAPVAAASAEPVELTWEQLMPKGEEDVLTQLYADYYEELDKRLAQEAGAAGSGDAQDLISAITEGSANDTMEQIGTFNVVNELNGLTVRLPGYVVPFDFNAQANYREFLLVPYFGACLHTPPPPPNQIVFVKADPAANIGDIYEPVWVEGVLKTGQFNSDLADSAYELTLNKVEAYVY